MMMDAVTCIREFLENEARSCSMDFGCVTPEYVQRMLGGVYSIDEIRDALKICLKIVMSVKGFLKGLWQFCEYLFVPRWR